MDIKYQAPATGILQICDYGAAKMYKAVCQCGSDDCAHTIDVESDSTGVTVTIYTKQRTNFWSKTRWSNIWKLLTRGYISLESSIVLDERAALNYAETIKVAVTDVAECRARSGC
jgi:hypothetical protein